MKYVFVTGGVVSGLGKGITAASLGRLLKERGYKVMAQKLDPYINIDPGTMSPLQHGEVYVTEDGAETDLDLGHYERFINEDLNKYSNLTTGKVYWRVLNKERKGEYLGQTIQTIPHITDEIKNFIYKVGAKADADIVITEIGGTVGDIESQPFIEAIRQIWIERPEDVCFIHVTLVPYISGSDEFKSKPTQHSVAQLQVSGVRPNIIVCRCDGKLPEEIKRKISLFCNVRKECVIENTTVSQLYEAPLMLEEQNFSNIVCEELHLNPNPIDLTKWKALVDKIRARSQKVTIGLVGKYVALHDAYLSVVEALRHGGYENDAKVKIIWIDSEELNEDNAAEKLKNLDGVIVPGGFGSRGTEGMVVAAHYCRTNKVPYFGICLGMQVAAIEFARYGLGYKDANSSEFNPDSSCKIIHYIEGQNDEMDKGGTMRLGSYPCTIKEGSLLEKCYKSSLVGERHRHRYEFNNEYRDQFIEKGMNICGIYAEKDLVEEIEYTDHPFYLGVQYHPEFKSRPNKAHPIFREFIKASLENQNR